MSKKKDGLYMKEYALREETQDLSDQYINRLNSEVFNDLNYSMLNESYGTEDKLYAKEILNKMHDIFIEVYGASELKCSGDEEYVTLPAVIQSKNTAEICIGLVDIDLHSQGEHWGTTLLTHSIIMQGEKAISKEAEKTMMQKYVPYNYWYTPAIEGDIHVNKENMPKEVREIIDSCYNQHESGINMM